MSPNSLLIYLGILAVLFAIVLVIMFVGYMRSGGRRRAAGSKNASEVEANRGPMAERLEQYPSRSIADSRGEDVGGNFSRVARSEDPRHDSTGKNSSR